MTAKHQSPCGVATCVDCIHRDTPESSHENALHMMGPGNHTVCGRRLRKLDDPKFDHNGKPIRKPVVNYTFHVEIVSCRACRAEIGLGPWTGQLVPTSQIARTS